MYRLLKTSKIYGSLTYFSNFNEENLKELLAKKKNFKIIRNSEKKFNSAILKSKYIHDKIVRINGLKRRIKISYTLFNWTKVVTHQKPCHPSS